MAGHSKWANIKHRKGAQDNKRGKVFSKIAKEIMVCARVSGGDPRQNINLRALIQKGRGANMPADIIERAIKKGTGELDDGSVFEELIYEGYAPGGVALVIETLTDNKNRTIAEVKHAFSKSGNSMATSGAVTRSFQRKGVINVEAEGQDEDALMELALESGAEDFERDGDCFTITTAPNDFMPVVDAMNEKEVPMVSSEITLVPDMTTKVEEPKVVRQIMRFIDVLDDLDDVQNVHSNLDVDDEVMAAAEEME